MRDPYKALGVQKSASDAEIKKAYRRLAKEYHPDRTGGDKTKEARFKDISAAYEILSDPEKKARFDTMAQGGNIPMGANLSEILAQMFGGAMGGGPRVEPHFTGQSPFGGGNPFGGMHGDPFAGMGGSPFGGGRPRPRPKARPKPAPPKSRKVRAADGSSLLQRGDDIYSDLHIPFHEAMLGTVAKVPTLTGSAQVRVPAGTNSGMKLRLRGKGARQAAKNTHGDHFVTIQIDVPKVEGKESRDLLSKLVESLSEGKV